MSRDSKQQFLDTYEHEHEITRRVLAAYPADQLELRPHPKLKNARELAWVFAMERGLGTKIWKDVFANGMPKDAPPPPKAPEDWNEVLEGIEKAHREFHDLVAATSDEDFHGTVHFFTGPKKIGPMTRKDVAWFLLHDEIHHRGQLSVYLRMSDAKVPSIYGPSGDEQWT